MSNNVERLKSERHLIPQQFTRTNIDYVGKKVFTVKNKAGSFRSRRGYPKGIYLLRILINDKNRNEHQLTIKLEPAGSLIQEPTLFHIKAKNGTTERIPLVLNKRCRVCIEMNTEEGTIETIISINQSSEKEADRLMKRVQRKRLKDTGNLSTERQTILHKFHAYMNRCNQLCHLSGGKYLKQSKDYAAYIEDVEPSIKESHEDIKQWLKTHCDAPLISIVMPTYNTNKKYLVECIESVRSQLYPYWELCICDDRSTDESIKELLKKYDKKDSRIKVKFREENGHICKATNDGLSLAKGDFIALLDHDDKLTEDALYYVAKTIVENPNVDLIYTDEDKINEKNQRSSPHFKPSFNIDLLLAYNYISHLGIYRRSVVEKIKGFRPGLEGSQDHDLALRFIREIDSKNIIHIPRILYHWRMHSESTAASPDSKDYTSQRGLKAIQDYLKNSAEEREQRCTVQCVAPNRFRVSWPVEKETSVELIIPTRDKAEILEVAVRSILEKTTYENYLITIVNNQSQEEKTYKLFEELCMQYQNKIKILDYNQPFNYSAINNFAAQQSQAEIIGLINNDIEVINGEWLHEMVSHCLRDDIGCVGAKLLYSNNTIQHAGVFTGVLSIAAHGHRDSPRDSPGYFGRLAHSQQLSVVTAACLLIKRRIFNEIGGLNELNLSVAFNDVDFCIRVHQRGYRNIYTPYAELYHHESISRGKEDTKIKKARFQSEINYMIKQYGDTNSNKLPSDPFYNPNLTDRHENFSINTDPISTQNGIRDRSRRKNIAKYYDPFNDIANAH